MLFTILLVSLILITVGGGILVYHKTSYNQADASAGFVAISLIVGAFISFMILLGAGSAASGDTKNHVTTHEKVYTIAETSVPVYESRHLKFSYVEDGKIFPYGEYVDAFSVGMDKPKALKITHYDVVDHSILPWVMADSTKVEVIK